jgi:hypothetical protein
VQAGGTTSLHRPFRPNFYDSTVDYIVELSILYNYFVGFLVLLSADYFLTSAIKQIRFKTDELKMCSKRLLGGCTHHAVHLNKEDVFNVCIITELLVMSSYKQVHAHSNH